MQIELDAAAVLQHLETDGHDPAEELLFGVHAHIQAVEEQVVVGAIRAVGAAQQVSLCGAGGRLSGQRKRGGGRQQQAR